MVVSWGRRGLGAGPFEREGAHHQRSEQKAEATRRGPRGRGERGRGAGAAGIPTAAVLEREGLQAGPQLGPLTKLPSQFSDLANPSVLPPSPPSSSPSLSLKPAFLSGLFIFCDSTLSRYQCLPRPHQPPFVKALHRASLSWGRDFWAVPGGAWASLAVPASTR